jgi:hypothetical protein
VAQGQEPSDNCEDLVGHNEAAAGQAAGEAEMTTLLIAVLSFAAGIIVGSYYQKVCRDEKCDELARENAMLHANLSILRLALEESLGRHHKVLKENGHD